MGRRQRQEPREFSADWPDEPCSDAIADGVRRLALNVAEAKGGRSVRGLARDAGLHHTVVLSLLAGESWPEVVTVLRLEAALGVSVWPGPAAGGGRHANP